ncbi:MAG: SpaA isopeptide-forming pilin-related protein [Clostridiaceae bacterium]|nr:SpaA isopeptide-forming pilin-related protein [Clostridiaceae bacterium]
MKNSFFKRSVSLLLSLIICLSTIVGVALTASAASTTGKAIVIGYPRNGDTNYSTVTWGHDELHYMGGWMSHKGRHTTFYTMNSYKGNICYCIEPGRPLDTGLVFTQKGEDFFDNFPEAYNSTISADDIKLFLGRILQYGYTGQISDSWKSQNAEDADTMSKAFATQLLVWETVVGERDEYFNHVTPNGYNAILEQVRGDHPLRNGIMNYYNAIASAVQQHTKMPSFLSRTAGKAQTIELSWDGSRYCAELTDTNGVIGNYNYSAPGMNCVVSGNKLIITSNSAPTDKVTLTAEKKSSQRRGLIIWSDGAYQPGDGNQDTVTFGQQVDDPVKGYINLKVYYGSAKIVKVSEDGKVDGITFRIQGEGVDQTVKTANGGVFQLDNLKPGAYTVTEAEYEQYEPQEVRRIIVVSGQVTTVTFSNTLRRGDLTVKKTAEDGLVEGLKFRLSGTSLSGIEVNEFAVTDENGIATFKDVLIGTGYVLEEIDTPLRYVVPDKQTAAVEWNKVTEKSFDNDLKKFNVTVTKSDRRTGLPQGDASLAGAKYGIYKGNQLIDTYTTDANGQFTTKYYICGNDWSLKEISPSEGYLLNTESQHIGAEAKLYTVEYNIAKPLDSYENIIKGKIAIIKHCDDGTTKIETPEVGAEFEVYLKAACSYENAEETERDILVCDENGFAETKDLPYGEYTVRQTKGWDGKELLAPFTVFVSEDGQVYRFLINNAPYEALIEIVKKDAETGKIIPAAGIGFKVRNTDTGEYIVQHINYPAPVDIDTYYTDVTGKLMMPDKLPYGNYEIIEQCTAYGYVLDSSPIAFKVDGEKTVVTVEKFNMPQKGIVNISKKGEIFFSALETDGVYSLVFADKNLAGATYEITAAEDIITPDGTLRYAKDTVVDTLTTDESGSAASKPLYLGKYTIRETKAPYGMVLNGTPKTVELTYAGETVEITETAAEFYNERQKAALSLAKILGRDETFDIGDNGEILSVQFGLYAAEDLFAADGSFVPKNGLLEIANCDENGNITFKTDIPVGAKLYVKEIATDSHYILSDEKYPVTFDYAGQDTALVEIKANGGEAIKNDILYGSVKGLKIDRETEKPIVGAKFGLFRSDEIEFTVENALLIAESGEDGIFVFENVPYGNWLIKELQPADGYLVNNEIYPVRISENGQTIGITVVNDRIPEIGTKATANGEKTATAEDNITIEDTVSYKYLIPGKAYTVKGVLMDKSTGKAFLIDGKELTSEVTFTPEESCGEVTVRFTFDGSKITKQTDIVVFETLYYDGTELVAHADIEDGGQTVTLVPPKPDIPQTGDNSNLGFWIGLGSVALGGVIACIIMYCKRKKDEDDE